jgi:RNA polymerase sigma factor (sigma-70 family)
LITLELIKHAQSGDRDALTEILRLVEHQVYQTAYYMLRNEQDALDLAQEALLRIYTKIHTYQERAQFKTWVQRIVVNVCIDFYRVKKPTISVEEFDLTFVDHENVETAVMRKFSAQALHEAIEHLNTHYRTAILLRYLHDFSYQEISDTMELPMNTVKSYIFRAKQQLNAVLSQSVHKEG